MKYLKEKQFLCLWDSRFFQMAGNKIVSGEFFNEENGYNAPHKQLLDELEIFEIQEISMNHFVQRIE